MVGQSGILKNKIKNKFQDGNKIVLDIGCKADICLSSDFKEITVISLDFEKDNIKKALKKYRKARYILAHPYAPPFKSDAFNFVLARKIIEHLTNPEKMLHGIKRILKKDGLVFICAPSLEIEKSLYIKIVGIDNFDRRTGHVVRGFTVEELNELLGTNGFRIQEITYETKFFNRILWDISMALPILRYPLALFWPIGKKVDDIFFQKGIQMDIFASII